MFYADLVGLYDVRRRMLQFGRNPHGDPGFWTTGTAHRAARRLRWQLSTPAKEPRHEPEAVIVSTARTPLAKSFRGAFNMSHGSHLGGHAVKAAIERAKIDPAEVEDVIMGCALPEGATGSNIARVIAYRAGCPVSVAGITINRFCSSGLQAIAMAAQRIISGEADIFVAGGVESISCVQNTLNTRMLRDSWILEHKPEIYWPMLETAEFVARKYKITRESHG